MAKINILVVPSDNMGGVGFYRSTQPHIQLEKQFPDEFSVTIDMQPDFSNLEVLKKYQIIHIHKGIFNEQVEPVFKAAMAFCKREGIVTIMDIDDAWELGMHHPQFGAQKYYKTSEKILENFKIFDYVTTTTPIFAKKISKYNKNVIVLPNAIDPTDGRFAVNKKPSDKIRIGMIMGSTHEYDMMLLNNIANGLPKDVLDKIQFVLCGFDLRGYFTEIGPDGKESVRPMKPTETVWYRYEKMLTNNYKIVSPEYKNFLHLFLWNVQYPNVENEHYKRCWTKDMNHYYEHYSECDVLLAPLEVNNFNLVKSQLKVVECAFSDTAIIASDFGPYTIDLKNAIEKGGVINPDGNAILIGENHNHKDWRKSIERIVKNPELLKQLQNNIHKLRDAYDLRNVTVQRANFYKDAVNKANKNQ